MPRPAHHNNDSRTSFRNPWSSARRPTWRDVPLSLPFSLHSSAERRNRPSIEVIRPDWAVGPHERSEHDRIVGTWLGHATALAEFRPSSSSPREHSTYVLFDPIFSMRAGPTAYIGPGRFNAPPCSVGELPGCDAVCISHNHYDHLDAPTVSQILERFPAVRWFVPLGNKAWLIASGVKAENVEEMDWWHEWEGFQSKDSSGQTLASFRISCVPAQHTSARSGLDVDSTLWCGWSIERFLPTSSGRARQGAVYHAGDTGYRAFASSEDVCPAFREIGERYGEYDLSFIPIWRGGSLSLASYVGLKLHHHQLPMWNHCSPGDAVRIHKDVRSRNTIAMHFGTFVGSQKESDEALNEFLDALGEAGILGLENEASAKDSRAGAVNIGQSFDIQLKDGYPIK